MANPTHSKLLGPIDHIKELCELVLKHLDSPAPSLSKLDCQPPVNVTKDSNTTLKSLSMVSKNWRQLTAPFLFRHARLRFMVPLMVTLGDDLEEMLEFFQRADVTRKVKSLTLLFGQVACRNPPAVACYGFQWRSVFGVLNPRRLTIVAPSQLLLFLMSIPLPAHSYNNYPAQSYKRILGGDQDWSCSNQLLSLECESTVSRDDYPRCDAGLLAFRPWTSMLFNESYFDGKNPDTKNRIQIVQPILEFLLSHPAAFQPPIVRKFTHVVQEHLQQRLWPLYLPRLERLTIRFCPRKTRRASFDLLKRGYRSFLERLTRTNCSIAHCNLLHKIECGDMEVEDGQEVSRAWQEVTTELVQIFPFWTIEEDGRVLRNIAIRPRRQR